MKNKNKVCIYAISKNEEQFVDKWMDSVSEADLVLVLDTGSTDNTVEKLKARGAVVYQKEITPWRFDVARNEALDLVPEEYNILFSIDLDETVEPGFAKILKDNWDDSKYSRAVYKYAWSHDMDGNPQRIFQYDKIHSRKWRWRCPVHELLWNTETDSNSYDYTNTLMLFNDIYVHHYPDLTKSRGSYLPLLEQRAAEYPDDYYGLIYLAHEYHYRGFDEKCISKIEEILTNYKEKVTSVEEASLYLFKGDAYSKLGDTEKASASYYKALKIEPTYREPYLALGKILLDEKMFELAYDLLKTALNTTYRHYTWLERDSSWTSGLYDLLSLAAFYADKKGESLVYAQMAANMEPSNERLRNNLLIIGKALSEADIKQLAH